MKFLLWPPTALHQITDPQTGIRSFNFFDWLQKLFDLLKGTLGSGFTGTVTIAKLTGGGANGTLTYVNGVVTKVVPPT